MVPHCTASQCEISLTDDIASLAFSPHRSTLATVTSKSLELWSTITGINQKTQILSGEHFHTVAFSSRGQFLLLSIDQGLHLRGGTDASELSVLLTDWSHKVIIFTSNDTQVITGSKEGYIHFFMLSGNRLSEMQERRIFNEAGVKGLVLRHDGKRLVSSGEGGTIRIYDLPSQSPIATLQRPESVDFIWAIAYHPTEEELAVCLDDGCVVFWRQKETPSDWMPSIHSNHSLPIIGITYCQNGTRMYMSTSQGEIKLWVTKVTQVQEPPKHASCVVCYAVDQPTSLLATGSQDKSIILWNLTTGDYSKTLLGQTGWISSLIFSDDGVLLASGGDDRTAIVWDVASGSLLHKLGPGPPDSCSDVLAFSEDNAHLTTSTNEECFVWELESRELLQRRDRDGSVDKAHTAPYYHHLNNLSGWQMVVEESQGKKCKYGLCRLPGNYRLISGGPIFGDRAVLFCDGGAVLILDISRVMHLYGDPASFW